MPLASQLLARTQPELALLYIWGHSWELDGGGASNSWSYMADLCATLGNQTDIWYATNIEVADYLNALRAARFSLTDDSVTNNSTRPIWVKQGGQAVELRAPGHPGALDRRQLFPGASEFHIPILATAVSTRPFKTQKEVNALAAYMTNSKALTGFEARVLLSKIQTINQLVSHLTPIDGGRHVPEQLHEWMNTKLVFWGPSRHTSKIVLLGDVVVATAQHGIRDLEVSANKAGYSLLGRNGRRRMSNQGVSSVVRNMAIPARLAGLATPANKH